MRRPKLPIRISQRHRDIAAAWLDTAARVATTRGRALHTYLGRFSARHHGLALGVATVIVALFAFLGEMGGDGAIASQTQTRVLAVPAPAMQEVLGVSTPIEREPEWRTVEVMPGQTLAQIFGNLGLTARDVHRVVSIDENTARLARIYPGDELAFRLDDEGRLAALEYQLDEATRLRVTAAEGGLRSELLSESLVRQIREVSGIIEDSFYLAGKQAGLTDPMILEVARLFGWDIDFILDIRVGDRFHVIYEEVYRDGEFLRAGDVIGATFVNRGREFQALRFETPDGIGFYSPDGRNMKKAFLRAPLNFTHISSHFNPKRFHPILKTVRPHRGIDYGAPAGTPVYASGDGRIVRSGYDNANGHHVFIDHPNGITTKYLHFTRRTVKRGDRVRQGQVIGFVGSTGLATAAHLHYEFLLNGVHRNPATVELPKADPLPPALLAEFQETIRPVLAQLDRLAAVETLAAAE